MAIAAGGLRTDNFPELRLAEVGPWGDRSAITLRHHYLQLFDVTCYFRHKSACFFAECFGHGAWTRRSIFRARGA